MRLMQVYGKMLCLALQVPLLENNRNFGIYPRYTVLWQKATTAKKNRDTPNERTAVRFTPIYDTIFWQTATATRNRGTEQVVTTTTNGDEGERKAVAGFAEHQRGEGGGD